jgi:hypothetical protein
MTLRTNSRVAGFAFLFYIAVAGAGAILEAKAAVGDGVAEKLASIAQHLPMARLGILLELLGCLSALVLAVTLYAITRDVDPDLALMILVCRTAEGVIGAVGLSHMVGKLWLATSVPQLAGAEAIGAMLFKVPTSNDVLPATFFAIGSLAFAWLLRRGRMVPPWMSGLGVVASALLVVALPLQLAGFLSGSVVQFLWIPMAAFEIPLGVWLLVRGARAPGDQA